MPDNASTKNLSNGAITFKDGTGTPKVCDLEVEEGDLEYVIKPKEGIPVLDRGKLRHFTSGPENPVTFSMTVKYRELGSRTTSGSVISPYDFVTKSGGGSALISTSPVGPFTFTMEFKIETEATVAADDQDELLSFAKCHVDEISFKEGAEYSTLRIVGKALITAPTITRSAP